MRNDSGQQQRVAIAWEIVNRPVLLSLTPMKIFSSFLSSNGPYAAIMSN
ncbi:MAG: hypothetical protein EBE86_007955 [Hormoscilla sp. GUM202]|nr:hypothetical protein [Hormoscilla sp. GUM202]